MAKAKQLPSGTWRALCYAGKDASGKRIYESVIAQTEAECNYLAHLFEERHREVSRDSKAMTLGEGIDLYIESRNNVLSPATVREYYKVKRNYFTDLQQMQMKKLKKSALQQAVNTLSARVSPKTVLNAWSLIHSVLREYHPTLDTDIKLPQRRKFKGIALSGPQISALAAEISKDPLELPLLLVLWLGLRKSEIVALKWENIDLEAGTITIDTAVVLNVKNQFVEKTTKTEDSTRTLEIPPYIKEKLEKAHAKTGRIMTCHPHTIYDHLKRCAEAVGIPALRLHDLRHTFASVLLLLGIPDQYAMEMGGWSSNHTMKTVYQHTIGDEKKAINSIVNKHLESLMQHEMQHENAEPLKE